MSEEYVWTPPTYNISTPPKSHRNLNIASGGKDWNFARCAKWSPDGSAVLAQCENRAFEVQEIEGSDSRVFRAPGPIVDFAWFPTASSKDPSSYCFASSVRECPVKLLDATDGRLRASYRIVDHRERQIAPHSLAFNMTAERLYCGFEDAIEVFDVGMPGEGKRLATTPTKKSKDGLKGIISALAFCPSYTPGEDFFAAGSLTPTASNIALFNSQTGTEAPVMFAEGGPKAGVMQLMFNPSKPHLLYASFRRDTNVWCWDLRSTDSEPCKFYSYGAQHKRASTPTNQKRKFDIDLGGKWLSIGDQNGSIHFFDLDDEATQPALSFPAHRDAIGSTSFHPLQPHLLSVSGSRHFPCPLESDSESSSEDSDGEVSALTRPRDPLQPMTKDSSIRIWDFSKSALA